MVDDAESFLDFLSNNDKVSLQEVEQNILFPDGEIPSFQDALSLNLIREGYGKGKISSFYQFPEKYSPWKNFTMFQTENVLPTVNANPFSYPLSVLSTSTRSYI